MEQVILYLENNASWLTVVLLAVVALLLFLITVFKKGKVEASDISKIVKTVSVLGTAVNLLMDKEVNNTNEKTSCEKKSKKE